MEGNHFAAKALTAIFGAPIYCEKEAREAGNPEHLVPVEMKDIFYRELVVQAPTHMPKLTEDSGLIFDYSTGKLITSYPERISNDERPLMLDMTFFGGVQYIPDFNFDPSFDYDFTNYKGDDTNCTRGGYPYKRPAGWKRKALRVVGMYEDDVWLGQNGWRDGSSSGEWIVSYFGSTESRCSKIVREGYDPMKSVRQMYGPGIYSTPDFNVAEAYAKTFEDEGKIYKCILQNRVNPKETKVVEIANPDRTYFVTENKSDIRPYGLCTKEIS